MKDYTNLGTFLTNKNELPETENRITNASRACDALLPLQKSQSVSEQKKIYMTSGNIQSRILYIE